MKSTSGLDEFEPRTIDEARAGTPRRPNRSANFEDPIGSSMKDEASDMTEQAPPSNFLRAVLIAAAIGLVLGTIWGFCT